VRVAVTGAGGFIGSHVVEAFVRGGHQVVAVDAVGRAADPAACSANLGLLAPNPAVTVIDADLVTDDLGKVVEADVIVHLAGRPGVRTSFGDGEPDAVRDNVTATARLLAACAEAGTRPRVVFASSSSVYGASGARPHHETDPVAPASPYAHSKVAAERLVLEADVSAVVLRYFSVYGPRQRADMAFHRFIRAGLRGEPLPVFGSGDQRRSFTHVSDVVAATVSAAVLDVPGEAVLNVGAERSVAVRDAIAELRVLMGLPLPVRDLGSAAGDVTATWADSGAARRVLGWRPRVGLAEGLADQVAWQREALRHG
jgi:nucleoside-diphosphate-sugar epimerase